MQSRKKMNQEIERKKKNKRRTSVGIGILILLLISAGIAWFAYGRYQESWVMTFDGNRVSTNELRHFVDQAQMNNPWSPPEHINDEAVEMLLQSLAIISLAESHNLGVTSEELDEALPLISEWPREARHVSNRRIADFTHIGPMFWRLADHYFPNYELDMDEIADELAMHLLLNLERYAETEARLIFGLDREEVENAREAMLLDPTPDLFDELIRTYCFEYDEAEGVATWTVRDLVEMAALSFETGQSLYSLRTGEISEIFEHHGGYLLVYVISHEEADAAAAEASFIEQETNSRRFEHVQEMVDNRIEDANVELNQRALDALFN